MELPLPDVRCPCRPSRTWLLGIVSGLLGADAAVVSRAFAAQSLQLPVPAVLLADPLVDTGVDAAFEDVLDAGWVATDRVLHVFAEMLDAADAEPDDAVATVLPAVAVEVAIAVGGVVAALVEAAELGLVTLASDVDVLAVAMRDDDAVAGLVTDAVTRLLVEEAVETEPSAAVALTGGVALAPG